jgi:hypothetical protein
MVAVMAYILGHLVSVPADWLLEEGLVKRVLGRPTDMLVRPLNQIPNPCPSRSDPSWWQASIAIYWQPLSCRLQTEIRKKASSEAGEELFFKGYAAARKDEYARDRMLIFSRLYIFSRNMAFAFFLAAIGVLLTPLCKGLSERILKNPTAAEVAAALPIYERFPWLPNRYTLAVIFFVLGLVLLYRYLFFFRLYSIEVFVAYASAQQ